MGKGGYELYGFQRVGVRFLAQTRRALLCDDMGLGKTAQAVKASLQIGADRVLVVCPNTLKGNWRTEIERWAPGEGISVLRGSPGKRQKIVREYTRGYLVINVESVRRREDAEHDLLDDLLSVPWDVLIVDEAHSIKNRKAAQTKGVRELALRTGNVYFLTGTPIMNRVDELWSPLNMLRPRRYPSFWSFVKRHAIVYKDRVMAYNKRAKKKVPRDILVVDGKPTRPDELRRDIAPLFLRREKEEVFPDMPPKVYQDLWLDMGAEQSRVYKEVEEKALADIDEETTLNIPGILARLTRCRQVAVSPELLGGKPDSVKLEALMEIIQGTDRKMVVFSQFAQAIKLIAGLLKEAGVGYTVLIGETKEEERNEAIERFQSTPEVRVLLATVQAGGSGINLTAASLVVFLDRHWTPAVNEQAVDRTRPHLQKRSVQVVNLLCRGTVDEMVEAVLAGKASIVEAIIKKKKEKEYAKGN
jgi:SNF2 family DNA or RNA helicase